MAPRTSALSGSCRSKGVGFPSRSIERKRLLSVSACLVAFFMNRSFLYRCAILCRRRSFVATLLGPFFIQLGVFPGNLVKQFHHCQLFFEVLIQLELEEWRLAQREVLGQPGPHHARRVLQGVEGGRL